MGVWACAAQLQLDFWLQRWLWLPLPRARLPTLSPAPSVTARKDDATAAIQAANVNVAVVGSISDDGGLIQTTSG